MLIAVDVDDVVADLLPAWIERYNRAYADNLDYRTIRQWDLLPYVKPECGPAVYELVTDSLYDRVEPVAGAAEAIQTLRAQGHRVIFVTAGVPDGLRPTPWGYPQRKLKWLQDWSFLDDADREAARRAYVEAYDKSLIRADVLIDDKPANCEAFAATGGTAILFDRGHNRDYPLPSHIRRAAGWRDVLRLLRTSQLDPDDLEALLHPARVSDIPDAELRQIQGCLYQAVTAGWASLPVIENFTQLPGDHFRYVDGRWWERVKGEPLTAEVGAFRGATFVNTPVSPNGHAARATAPAPESAPDNRLKAYYSCNPVAAVPDGAWDWGQPKEYKGILHGVDRLVTEKASDGQPTTPAGYETPEDMAQHGVKFDTNKPRFDLLPPGPMLEVAQLFTWGCRKYDARNWEKGMPWGKVYRAMLTHAHKFWMGFEADEEHGLSHLASVAWCALVLMEYGVTHRALDDRPRYTDAQRRYFLDLLDTD